MSFQNALNKVFHALGDVFGVPTPSAYSHARQKLKPEVFTYLQRSLCAGFYQLYEADEQVQRWRGHRLLATDGTYLTVPDTPQTRAQYTVQTNQHAGADCVQAQCGVLYDLRNDLGVRLHLSARQSETRVLRDDLWRATQPGDVIVLDRAYADYSLLAWAQAQQRHLIVRLPRGRFAECEAFWQSHLPEQIVTLTLPTTASTRAFVAQQNLPPKIRVRLVRVLLSSGEVEVLLTTLCDAQAYPAREFKPVYGERWGEETFFDRFKNIFEVERFSGTTVAAVEQDIVRPLLSHDVGKHSDETRASGTGAARRGAGDEIRPASESRRKLCRLTGSRRAVALVAAERSGSLSRIAPPLSQESDLATTGAAVHSGAAKLFKDRALLEVPQKGQGLIQCHCPYRLMSMIENSPTVSFTKQSPQ